MTDSEQIIKSKETKIKEWYKAAYPHDEFVEHIKDDVTFWDLFEAMDNYQNVYETIFVNPILGDSIIRERCFQWLAETMDVEYEYINEQWLTCKG